MSSTKKQTGRISFSQYDKASITVVLDQALEIVCSGVARYELDENLGCVLRIRSGGEAGRPEVILSEQKWQGKIVAGAEYGTEFCFVPTVEEPQH